MSIHCREADDRPVVCLQNIVSDIKVYTLFDELRRRDDVSQKFGNEGDIVDSDIDYGFRWGHGLQFNSTKTFNLE